MKNKINFITGETYTLAELFSGNRRIIIPDLQRDYCWGDKIHTSERKELVSGYLMTLIQQYEKKSPDVEKLNLGLIYGYEVPANHIQLCDGQQRITTLFLLLGFLNKKSKKNAFQTYLMSDYELLDDKEPYLQYSIRETSLYFLSDLVCHFFLQDPSDKERVDNVNDIESCSWFFNEYRTDPSINSMIKALNIIDNTLKNRNSDWCILFGDFLINRLTFMYYDMENRKNGEETFVVINTTGEPLTQTQNLKPLVVTDDINKGYSSTNGIDKDWEEIETWFWKNRNNGNDTADAGFTEFLRWVSIIKLAEKTDSDSSKQISEILSEGKYSFNYSEIPFSEIYDYWKAVERVFNSSFFEKKFLSPAEREISTDEVRYKVKALTQIDCFRLLPLIAYCKRHICDINDKNATRLYHFIYNLSQLNNIQRNVNTLAEKVIQIALECDDVLQLLDPTYKDKFSDMILTDEELLKLQIIKNNISERDEIEKAFWNAQTHPIFKGEIRPLVDWTMRNGQFDVQRFNLIKSHFDQIFPSKVGDITDLTRRSLVTMNSKRYPLNNNSFGYTSEEWKTIIFSDIDKVGLYLYRLFNSFYIQPTSVQASMVNGGVPEGHSFSQFVEYDYLLDYCDHKRVGVQSNDKGILLYKRQRASSYSVENAILLHKLGADWKCSKLSSGKLFNSTNNWKIWYYLDRESNCVVIESEDIKVAIDIINYKSTKQQITISCRKEASINNNTLEFLEKFFFCISTDANRYQITTHKSLHELIQYLEYLVREINTRIP